MVAHETPRGIAPRLVVLRRAGPGRLVPFEFNTEQVYLLVFSDTMVDVYRDSAKVTDFSAPWSEPQIPLLSWVQSADTLLVTHPDVAPGKIVRNGETDWQVVDWSWPCKNV